MTTALMGWVLEHAPQRGALKLLLIAMADNAGGGGAGVQYRTSLDYLTQVTNETADTVRMMLVQLEADDIIAGSGERAQGVSAYYDLICALPAALPRDAPGQQPYVKAKISQALRAEIFRRDGYRCKHCGSSEDLRVDHIFPERYGGTLALENLQTLCQSCNSKKGVRVAE